MTQLPLTISSFDFAHATDHEYAAVNRYFNRAQAETLPDDPPVPLEETIAQMQNIPPFVSVFAFAGWDASGAEMLAGASASFLNTPENAHLVNFDIHVHPEYRSQGLGRELLRRVVEVARREGRRLMITGTSERIPAGEAFMNRLGAERGLEMHVNQLILSDLDMAQVARWQGEGQERAAGFSLGFWDGSYPSAELDAIAALNDVMNTAPRDGLDVEDSRTTPEQLRQMEQMMAAEGTQRWTFYASEVATDRFAGFTEVRWSPSSPQIVHQGATGVFPEFRGKSLGRWLKAAMVDRIRRELPEARFIRTGNADSNAAMLGINEALGFKPYFSRCIWQLETDKAASYLER